MAKQNTENTEVVDDDVFEDEVIEVTDSKRGLLTRIGEGITHAGEKLDEFNRKHKIVSTIATVGTGILIGAGATAAYVKHSQTGIGVADDDNFDDDGYIDVSYSDPTVSDDTTKTE